MAGRARLPILLFLGTLLVQAAWILTVPAFRGIDEFDHAYRAAAVARGEWVSSYQPAPAGRGDLVTVPRDLVTAAGPECRSRKYTGHDNCSPVGDATGDPVQVATAASRYHPLFYWVIGEPARAFHGGDALYAMRITAALLCASFVALAGWAVSRWARTPWPVVALLAALSPTVLYSSTIAAPNGLEILAGISVWAALTGLSGPDLDEATERALLWAAVPGAMVLSTLRSLGIGWLLLCVGLVLVVTGWARARDLARRHRRTLVWCGLLVGAAVIDAVVWLATMRPNQPEEHSDYPGAVVGSLIQVPVWVLQSIATGIGRADPAPGLVYLTCGTVLAVLVGAGLRRAPRRLRRVMLLIAVASVAGPLVITLATYRDVGVIWQGRYGLPFSSGLVVLAGLALERLGPPPRAAIPWVLGGVALFGVGQAADVTAVLASQRRESPSVALGLWHVPSPWLIGTLALAGWAVLGLGLVGWWRGLPRDQVSTAEAAPIDRTA